MALTVDGQEYLDWRVWTPPRTTWVWALFREGEKPTLVKTCRQGCCVHSWMGSMVLPRWWRLASEEDGAAEQARWAAMPKINLSDLYD